MNPVADRHIRPWSSERLELGEGARWIDGHLHLVDLLAGRLLVADLQSVPGLREVLRVAGPLGAVAARAGHVGSWIAAMGPGIALIEIGRGPEWLARDRKSVV